MAGWFVVLVSGAYLGLLFAIAYYGDERADRGRSLIGSSAVYALSIAVYCTSRTFYGSVGRASQGGIGFLPIYLGPTLVFCCSAWAGCCCARSCASAKRAALLPSPISSPPATARTRGLPDW